MVEWLAIFGATGDLTARYLLPGLASLRAAGRLGDDFRLTGAGREDWDSEQYRRWAEAQLGRHAADVPAGARQAVVSATEYRRSDVGDPADVAAVIAGGGPVAAYLAGLASQAPGVTFLERTVNGQPGLVAQQNGVTVTVFAFHIAGGRIRHIWVVRNPEKLRPWTPR